MKKRTLNLHYLADLLLLLLLYSFAHTQAIAAQQALPTSTPVPAMVSPASWQGTAAERARAATVGFASPDVRTRLAAVLGALAASGVPVIATDGSVFAWAEFNADGLKAHDPSPVMPNV